MQAALLCKKGPSEASYLNEFNWLVKGFRTPTNWILDDLFCCVVDSKLTIFIDCVTVTKLLLNNRWVFEEAISNNH